MALQYVKKIKFHKFTTSFGLKKSIQKLHNKIKKCQKENGKEKSENRLVEVERKESNETGKGKASKLKQRERRNH